MKKVKFRNNFFWIIVFVNFNECILALLNLESFPKTDTKTL